MPFALHKPCLEHVTPTTPVVRRPFTFLRFFKKIAAKPEQLLICASSKFLEFILMDSTHLLRVNKLLDMLQILRFTDKI